MREGEIPIVLQIIIQGLLSATGLRAYPFYYFLAIACDKLLGKWFSVPIVVVANIIQSMLTLYITTYNRYVEDRIKIDEILLNRIRDSILANLRESGINPDEMTLNEIEEHFRKSINNNRAMHVQKTLKKQKCGFVFREEPSLAITIGCRTFFGSV